MRILLINPMLSTRAVYFPLGLGYIASILLNEGCEVRVLDINALKLGEEDVAKQIAASGFDIVGITALITQYTYVKWLTETVRRINPSARIVIGGGLATAVPEIILKNSEADISVIGEGEDTIREVITALRNNTRLKDVRGIYFKENGNICRTELRAPIENLDSLPLPARHLFPMEKYIGSMDLGFVDPRIRATNLVSSRGCPYNCVYCCQDIFSQTFRARSVPKIIEEIQLLKRTYNLNGITFNDDTFVLDRKRVQSFCAELIRSNTGIHWACNGRANLVDSELLKTMANAGCKYIAYGIESGNQAILDSLNKKVTVEQAKQAIELTWKAGIFPHAYLMIGMFGETRETIEDTLRFCKDTCCGFNFSYVTPFPGTMLCRQATEAGIMPDVEALLQDGKLNDIATTLVVNLTGLSDEELGKLKRMAEYRLIVDKLNLRMALNLYMVNGIRILLDSIAAAIAGLVSRLRPR